FNSGTSTLHAALEALDVNAGDEVIIPPLTVISNINVVLAKNAVPVFADIDPDTFNMDPADIARKMTRKTKAIMPVALYGLSYDIEGINALAKQAGIGVINDAAEAFASKVNGKDIAQQSDITSYSTENSKHITTGDGGIVVTDNEDYAVKMRKFGSLGYAAMTSGDGRIRINKDIFQNPNYKRHDMLSLNYRMPEVAAALGLAQTERMEHFIELRQAVGKKFSDAIADVDYLVPQLTPENYTHSYWTFVCKYERDDVSWEDFRQKYVEFGGDGIYAAWALTYDEIHIANGDFKRHAPAYFDGIEYPSGLCPVAEALQPKLMQFVTNYGSAEEADPKVDALRKTIAHFA
ncbi:DegT/DnrJ/EryC1/StrS family aminotransferase, partial [Verrucomicrobia bacterium]|nr:DegT/DnrJ/EryC1/StrS family aminotransferase [Verrucomicrobiota bacterium]